MQRENWWNHYVGIDYADKGRDRATGLDCWGLNRLIQSEQFGNDVPSLVGDYDNIHDPDHLAELIAREKEHWVKVDLPREGDTVLFRVLGQFHVGTITEPGKFIHVRENGKSVIESLSSPLWRNRIKGFYRYCTSNTPVQFSAAAHPLRTERIEGYIPAGRTVQQTIEHLKAQQGVAPDMPYDATVWVDGREVAVAEWETFVPAPGARVEVRAVAKKSGIGRIVAMVAVMVVAWYLAPIIAAGAGFAGNVVAIGIAQSVISMAGSMLVNAIFPVRPPEAKPNDTPEKQLLMQGGQNRPNPYGAIPVVLGRFRYTGPLAAQTYTETNSSSSYLRMAILWGYGPLAVSDLRIGDVPISQYEEVTVETVNGETGESLARFNSIYGKDVKQLSPQAELLCVRQAITSANRTSNVVTVVTPVAHNYSVNMEATLMNADLSSVLASGTITEVTNSTTFKFAHAGANGAIAGAGAVRASAWLEYVIDEEVDQLKATFHFPMGLRQGPIEGGNAGDIDAANYRAIVQYRQLDSNTLAPITPWGDFDKQVKAQNINLASAWFNIDSDAELEKVYQWTRFSVDEYGKVVSRTGAMTNSQFANPSGNLLTRLQETNFGMNVSFERLPTIDVGEELLWDVCVYGDSVVSLVDNRDASITGCLMTNVGRMLVLNSGTVTRADSENVRLGGVGEPYRKRKDAFTHNVTMDVARGKYQLRVRRTNESNDDYTYPSGNAGRRFHTSYLQAITGYATRRPITPPAPLAMTALRIKATNQLNGTIEGVTATVQSICLDYDHTTDTWIERPTRNPASLMRYVLQHPANAKRVTNAQLDLPSFVEFHNYCRSNGFTYDAVHAEQRSLWDVLLDIAAAGRASPTRRDGKHSVIIDKPRSSYAQFFTPDNSWGFESTRALPQLPHAFRVQFNNAEKSYQPDERIVYNDGYSVANATLFEGLQLPGVTKPSVIFKHARFHYAQLKLRPEQYTLYADIEHLVCQRGDLVRVTHDVPMWGLASGRIKDFTVVPKLPESIAQDYTLWAAGMSMPPAGYTLNGLPSENEMQSGIGPGGHTEPLWTCINQDTDATGGEGPDGGFSSAYVTTDCSKGHLFAIFVRTTVNDGNTYYGTSTNSSILNLAGTVNTNPYFIGGGDLPSLNTWYMVVGYVHPIGYAGDYASIAGIYNMSGTRLTTGNEFKFAAGAVNVMHRCFHFYNAIPSGGQPVQQMSRPVIVPCDVAQVPDKLARIRAYANGALHLDEPVPMDAGQNYMVRIRSENGTSVTRNVLPATADNYASQIIPTSSVTAAQAKALNLFMFGELNAESVELVVHGIEPAENMSARLTLVDYSPAVYDSDSEVVPAWDSQITLPPTILQRRIWQKPTITRMISDETVVIRTPSGGYNYGLQVSWDDPENLPERINAVQAEIDYANDNKERWQGVQTVMLQKRSATFRNLREGEEYVVRLRYVDRQGRAGQWQKSAVHTIVGKQTPPKAVTGLAIGSDDSGRRLILSWNPNDEIDLRGYEVREANSNWGTSTGLLWKGTATSLVVTPPKTVAGDKTWYVKAFDAARLYSPVASISFAKGALPSVTGLSYSISASSVTDDKVRINWDNVDPDFELKHFIVVLTLPGGATRTYKGKTSEWTTNFNWVGTAVAVVKAVDMHNSESAEASLNIEKLRPANVGAITKEINRRRIDLDWATVAKTTLPVAGYEVRKADSGWGTTGFVYRGTGSQALGLLLAFGANTFYVRAFDTDGVYSLASASISHTYSAPATPTNFVAAVDDSGSKIELMWDANTEKDLAGYEIRTANSGWGTAGYLWRGTATKVLTVPPKVVGAGITWYIKAIDTDGLYSTAAAQVTFTKAAVPTVTGLGYSVSGSSTTVDRIMYNWADADPAFALKHYEATLTLPDTSTRTYRGKTSEWITAFDWTGSATLDVRAVDIHGSKGGVSTLVVNKAGPNTVGAITKAVRQARITLDWPNVAKTTLPVAGYEVRTSDSGWGTNGYKYRGAGSQCTITMATGANTYYVRAFDTDGRYSAVSSSISHTYDPPPNLTSLNLFLHANGLGIAPVGGTNPADFLCYEYRLKFGVTTGDVWAAGAYDVAIQTPHPLYFHNTASTGFGNYRIAGRRLDKEGNYSAASAFANISLAFIDAP
jgi:hypothetical protein